MNLAKLQDTKSKYRNHLHFYILEMKKSEREIKESIPFITATKRIKYPGINLPKETKELCIENYETLMKEIIDDINRWKDIPSSWVGRINIVKMFILRNAIYRFIVIPIKLPMAFFTELEQRISQLIWKQKTPNSQSNNEKEEWTWRDQPSLLYTLNYNHQESMILA